MLNAVLLEASLSNERVEEAQRTQKAGYACGAVLDSIWIKTIDPTLDRCDRRAGGGRPLSSKHAAASAALPDGSPRLAFHIGTERKAALLANRRCAATIARLAAFGTLASWATREFPSLRSVSRSPPRPLATCTCRFPRGWIHGSDVEPQGSRRGVGRRHPDVLHDELAASSPHEPCMFPCW